MNTALVGAIIRLANNLLEYKNNKETRRYIEELLEQKEAYREETAKSDDDIDDNLISTILLRIIDLSEAIASTP